MAQIFPGRLGEQNIYRKLAWIKTPAHGVLKNFVRLAEIVPAGRSHDGGTNPGIDFERFAERLRLLGDMPEMGGKGYRSTDLAAGIFVVSIRVAT